MREERKAFFICLFIALIRIGIIMSITRKPAAAGRFYPGSESKLTRTIRNCFLDSEYGPGKDFELISSEKSQNRIIGGVCPHAGYTYSGPAAAISMQRLFGAGLPDVVLIFGTSHTGYRRVGVMARGAWKTPLGKIGVNNKVAKALIESSDQIEEDESAFSGYPHGREHCIEVQVPFIQYIADQSNKDVEIVPLKIGLMARSKLQKLGADIGKALNSLSEKGISVKIVASSDMTHYQPNNPQKAKKEIMEIQYERDQAVIDAFKEFDIEKTVQEATKTSVCGPQTIATLLYTAKSMGYNKTEALKYYTSFEKTGESVPCDYSVGYFSGVVGN